MENIYQKYINNTCTPEEFAEVMRRFQDPTRENEIMNIMAENWKDLQNEEQLPINNRQLLNKIHQAIITKRLQNQSRKKFLHWGMRIAALLIAALSISAIIWVNKCSHKQVILTQVISAPYGERTNIVLPDGSRVWLNSGSKISFPQTFATDRRIELSGEAFFDVTKNGMPFLVNTTHGLIQVIGTTFDVKSYHNEYFQATLLRGSIKLKSHKTNQEVFLHPGEQAIIGNNKNIIINCVDTELYTSWKDGKLIFYHEPLSSVSKQLERAYNVKIILKGRKIKNIKFTGSIEDESFTEILLLLKKTTPIEYTYNSQTKTLCLTNKK